MGKLFGTDGVRGIANIDLTPELAYRLGRVGAYVLTKEKNHVPSIIVAMDTRISGHLLESALISGICSVGATAISAGVLPTPAIPFLIKKHELDAGVVISASHNPYEFNGIKFFNKDGYKLSDELENEIEDILSNSFNDLPRPSYDNVGSKKEIDSCINDYVEFITNCVGIRLDNLKVSVDCANGASYKTAPLALNSLGAELSVIHDKPDGKNINKNCGSTHLQSLSDFIVKSNCDAGIAFDGDADRCIAIDENGDVVDGDKIMAICAKYLKDKGKLRDNTVISTVMSNLGFFIMAKNNGITIHQTAVGDRYVLEKMLESNATLGGEQSGHIIFLEHSTTGDGLLTAVYLLSIMKETGKKLSELASIMNVLPQVLINAKVNNNKKYNYLDDEVIIRAIQHVEEKYSDEGRVLIRPSGTEPLVRVMIEGNGLDDMTIEAQRIADLIESRLN